MPEPITYASTGVDVEAGDKAVELMKAAVARTHGPEVLGGVGGFAGLFDASALLGYRRPLLASSTDGVGTKVAIAQALDVHDTIGLDLVAMVVDDLVVCGAKPLVMTDYLVFGKVVPERVASIVSGIARGCEQAGTALVGGETAEHPGLLGDDEYDVAGAAVGVVEADELLGAERVRAGDVVVAMAASGVHSNGFSLVRGIIRAAGWDLGRAVPEFGRSLGEELLTPTRIYAADVLDLIEGLADGGVHAVSHVTGGGLAANLARVLPRGLTAVVDRSSWTPPPVFTVLGGLGGVPRADLERTWNLGVGMVAVVAPEHADAAVARLEARGVGAWVLGSVVGDDEEGASAGEPADVVQGAKGVDGGRVLTLGEHPN
ncbi:phosphoribosylformylglycinamidine cyclo-ligase [Spongisporangium articulatum]|uniref:Phosphoribosylformylglycinamidine cyclo-ligase n=1 Tax=Spongisporangium articulatum TaxID=3362603 RepID=A0ABW8AHB1_9ACTN